jgi:hypothetical protein
MGVELGLSYQGKRVFEKRVVRRIFGRKREEMSGGLGKVHNEKFLSFHPSPNIRRLNQGE